MPSFDDDIHYSYKNPEYKPERGMNQTVDSGISSNFVGYHNINKLRDMLTEIKAITTATIKVAEADLKQYTLVVEPESRLAQAQQEEWPSELGDPKNYISYQEYKALENVKTRGAEYIRKAYEDRIRGPFGTNAVDLINASMAIHKEAENIEDFLDNYIGDVSETSEYRALELLQDWAEEGLHYARGIGTVFTQRIQSPPQIPPAELDQISEDEARGYQAIFHTKVNTANQGIKQLGEQINKEYDQLSQIYYKKYLGPALKFQRKVATPLSKAIANTGFLARQAMQADTAMAADYASIMADQLKRNSNFANQMESLLLRVTVRDSYAGFFRELNAKIDSPNSAPFIETDITEEEIAAFESLREAAIEKETQSNEFSSQHSLLSGRDDDDAHSQYLLKAGDTITGDILMDAGIKIGGIVPGEHRHRGVDVDGSPKIRGEDIEDLVTTSIKKDEEMCRPANLRHVNNQPFTGTNNVTLVNSQIAWDCDPDLTFEVQTVPVGAKPTPPKPTVDYCVTTLYETDLDIVAGLASDFNFFTFATSTAVYNYNWTTGVLTRIAGVEGEYGDVTGDSISKARFGGIVDLTQDFFDGRAYIADGSNRKVKMTGKASVTGHTLPMDIATVYSSPYDIKRLDAQGQNFLNTLYVLVGPDNAGKDRVVKLTDIDGNNLQAGTYSASEIAKLSGVYSDILDIAVTPNGFVYLLGDETLYQYDPNTTTVRQFDISEETASPTAITSDHENNIYITYSAT